MKLVKRAVSLVLMLTVLAGACAAPASAANQGGFDSISWKGLAYWLQSGSGSKASDWAREETELALRNALISYQLLDYKPQEPITREEAAAICANLFERLSNNGVIEAYIGKNGLPDRESDYMATELELLDKVPSPFTDCNERVLTCSEGIELIHGMGDGTFAPKANISRQDLCVILYNVLKVAIDMPATGYREVSEDKRPVIPDEIMGEACLAPFRDAGNISDYAREAVVFMVDQGLLKGMSDTEIAPRGTTTREQAAVLAYRFFNALSRLDRISMEEEDNMLSRGEYPYSIANYYCTPYKLGDYTYPEGNSEKEDFVYGSLGIEFGYRYSTKAEAEEHMTSIQVPVWKLGYNGSKYSSTAWLTVNSNLAKIYKWIFEEIYNGPEQFPISDVGCFSWRSGEHSQGTAVDINANANMECIKNADGSFTPTTGSYWKPGEDPYSIKPDGDVVKAFEEYGFFWAGNGWGNKYDYMHFSYFGF